jgi:molybdenum cofactor biosynthesis enzyme MoaA
VKVVGVDCVSLPAASKLISEIRGLGCQDISITCAVIAMPRIDIGNLIEAGLTRITLSIHGFSPNESQLLQSVIGSLGPFRDKSLKVNRVLLASTLRDLPSMIDWVDAHACTLRLFSIMRTPTSPPSFSDEYVHWTSVVDTFAHRVERIEATDYTLSNRTRYKIRLSGGGAIEVNMPTVSMPCRLVLSQECRSCPLRAICEEGYFGCGIRLGADGRVYPCILRPELSFAV